MQSNRQSLTDQDRHSSIWQRIPKPRRFKSTTGHRESQRACAATEVINASIIAPVSVEATLPLKLAQFVLSTQAFFKPKITTMERTAHGVQGMIALGQTLLLSLIFFYRVDCNACDSNNIRLCQILSFLGYVYSATLLVGWIPAEISKEDYLENARTNTPNSNSVTLSRQDSAPPQDTSLLGVEGGINMRLSEGSVRYGEEENSPRDPTAVSFG